MPLFYIADVKRDGQRLIVSGGSDSNKTIHGRIELLLRNGEVRFDDVYDETGRSVKYERLPDGNPARRHGARTLGEAFALFIDARPCKA
jgi:hypothetical protein